ncbi:MAG TPA: hypothetical protein VFZ66_05980 [Herpetosiphonaceae bacterium]
MRRPPVVADTSPLIMLIGVGHLELLRHLYGRIVIEIRARNIARNTRLRAAGIDPAGATDP